MAEVEPCVLFLILVNHFNVADLASLIGLQPILPGSKEHQECRRVVFWRNHYRGALKVPRTPLRYLIMGSDAISALCDSLTTRSKSVAAVLRFFHSARAAFQNASFASIASSFRGLYRNDNVNWGQVVFLTTCLIAMTGCGLLSSLVKRRQSGSKAPRAQRPAVGKRSNKSSKSLSSSEEDYEDEDYDSNASLRHGTNPNYKKKEWPSDTQQQSSDGR